MFSLYPSAYSQHRSPYYHNNDYLLRDYFAQQQARERQAAGYRAHLEEARRRKVYQDQLARAEAMRRHNKNNYNSYMSGFDSDDDTYEQPYDTFFQSQPAPRQYPRPRVYRDSLEELLAQQTETGGEMKRQPARKERQASIDPSPSRNSSPVIPEAQVVIEKTMPPPPSSDLSVRDAAPRTIQTFARAQLRRLSALRSIEDISRRFEELKANFEFPPTLDFAEFPSSYSETTNDVPIPSLLYTPRNAQLHGHEHALVKLLSNLDAVESHGDSRVRRERKKLVMKIERELSALDEKKAEVWRQAVVAADRTKAMPVQKSFLENENCDGSDSEESGAISLDSDSELVQAESDTDVESKCQANVSVEDVAADEKCTADLENNAVRVDDDAVETRLDASS